MIKLTQLDGTAIVFLGTIVALSESPDCTGVKLAHVEGDYAVKETVNEIIALLNRRAPEGKA